MSRIILTRVVQTSAACPSQWDAWDSDGRYYYLRYRHGVGTVDTFPSGDVGTWPGLPRGAVARFDGPPGSGAIGLEEFLAAAGMALAPAARVIGLAGALHAQMYGRETV